MKFGMRKPSLSKSIAARTSPSRFIRHSLGVKAPRGMGWITNPKKAAYNRVYNRTTFSLGKGKSGGEALVFMAIFGLAIIVFKLIFAILGEVINLFSNSTSKDTIKEGEVILNHSEVQDLTFLTCPRCSRSMVKRMAKRGEHKGKEFWGCSGFPRCRGTRE